jgi:hypothetical protein
MLGAMHGGSELDRDERRKELEKELLRLRRHQEEARSGRFTVGDEPNTRAQTNIDEQVRRCLLLIDEAERELKNLDRRDG